jgi:hypothetical protein
VPRREIGTPANAFVRNQTALGIAVYAPAFAATTAGDPVAYAAGYLVVGGASFLAAREVARDVLITEPVNRIATDASLRLGLTGLAVANGAGADRHLRAGALFLGSLGGTAGGVAAGRRLSAGEVAAASFGANAFTLGALAATHVGSADADPRWRASLAGLVGLAGYPTGYVYARAVPYNVTDGDITGLSTTGLIGAMAAGAFVADGSPPASRVATVLAAGGALGTLVGDRAIVRRADHTLAEGRWLAAGAAAGGLMGAGVSALAGVAGDRLTAATAALTAAGAVVGAWLVEWRLVPRADAGRRSATNTGVARR